VRYTRQELKQNKFQESAAEAVHEVVEHRNTIVTLVVAVVLVAVLASGIWWYVTSHEEQASAALGNAMLTYTAPVVAPTTAIPAGITAFTSDQDRLIASKKAFYDISDKYGWTHSGQYARYMAGISESEIGNFKVAEDQLRALTNIRRKDLASLAKLALASVYRQEGRDADAINLLQALIDTPSGTVPKTSAQLALADLYEGGHQNDKALVIYQEIAKENPTGALAQIAKEHQAELK
jgi:predicted negative regulator of RcsB-dependent stress response